MTSTKLKPIASWLGRLFLKTAKKYELTEEHKAQLKPWADKWIANAMRTRPMDDEDRAAMRVAIKGLYEAAGKTPPPDHRIVFVPSPFVARFAGGFAAAIWYLRKTGKLPATNAATDAATSAATDAATSAATDAATRDATRDATYAATYAATRDATRDATSAATDAATSDATRDATDAATDAATYAATRAATDAATRDATDAAKKALRAEKAITGRLGGDKWFRYPTESIVLLAKTIGVGALGLQCAERAYAMWQGGNQWSAWTAFISFFRHVAKLGIDYSKWQHWEAATVHGSYRVMHEEFCIVSDFPTTLTVDAQNRPHCDTGPFSAWADGTALYALHGVRVPEWTVETPVDQIDPKLVLGLTNTEERYAVMRRVGIHRFMEALKAEVLDTDGKYRLLYIDIEGTKMGPYLFMSCPSTGREFLEGVGDAEKYDNIDPTIKTCKEANTWRFERAAAGLMTSQAETIFQA